MSAIFLEDISFLEVLDRNRPVYFAEDPDLDGLMQDPRPAFIVGATDARTINSAVNFGHMIVCSGKKEQTVLKKLGLEIATPECSTKSILEFAGTLGPITRRALAISNLKKPSDQIRAATQIGLVGESFIAAIMGQFPENLGFVLQEAFLDMKIRVCLDLLESVPPTRVVELGMLLLSGHTLAFAIQGSSTRAVMELGNNPCYVNKICDLSRGYIRKVDFGRATQALTSVLPRVKRGHEPHHLLRSTILEVLTT